MTPAAVGVALGLCVGGAASWLRRRIVIWWAPAGLVGAAFMASISGNNLAAPLTAACAALTASVLVRSAISRRRRLLLPDRTRRWCVAGAAAATVALGTLAGAASVVCTEPTHAYRILRTDPMDAEQLPGLELEYSASADQGSFETSAPKVKTSWRIVDGTPQSQLVSRLGRRAVDLGWARQRVDEPCDYRRTTDGVRMCLTIQPTIGPGRISIEISPEEWRPETSRC